MELLIASLLCIGGIAVLMKSADCMIDGALVIAHRLQLSKMLIGSTLLAFGTSAPEMVVNFLAAFADKGDIVVGNIVGSNLVNLIFGIGGAALIMPLVFTARNAKWDYPLGVLGVIFFFVASGFFGVSHWLVGGVMVAVFAGYLWHALHSDEFDSEDAVPPQMGIVRAVVWTVLGLVGLFVGGKLAIDGGVQVAELLGIRETVIALTVIAVGTSAPEVITCVQAARRGHGDIAIGNIAGSQIFNGLWVLGGSAIIADIRYDEVILQDLGLLVVMTVGVILLPRLFAGVRTHRWVGAAMIFIYMLYLAYIIAREVYF